MADDRLHVLGIRHHGPGSAGSVLDALAAIEPSAVLIEGPSDAEEILHFALAPGMRPPVALLIHAADDPAQAIFYPFAEFSPEWQALRWALERGLKPRLIDLPAASQLTRSDEPEATGEPGPDDEKASPLVHDPLGTLAAAAGESDGETWWNALIEQGSHSRDVFPAIAQAMGAVRQAAEAEQQLPAREQAREAQREAHMRLRIRDALRETEGPVAVICGAWHAPALLSSVPVSDDREKLKGFPRVRTSATWVPWTDTRLAAASGYGAGIVSPGWYRHLWRSRSSQGLDPRKMSARWQSGIAGLLRQEGLAASTASVIEATRLATSLAAVRGFAMPGLAEMQEASLAVLCHGETTLLRLIEKRLVIGTEIGEIDKAVPRMPLLADLERWQRRLRLKPSAEEEEVAVDLRSEAGLLKSTLLHRLLLIDVPWGRKTEAASGRGTFREKWLLAWQPELSVRLAEALHWGSTVEQAASGAALEAAAKATGVAELAELVQACLLADLPRAAERATERLQSLAVNSSDVAGLMLAVAPLANVLRYGTARRIPAEALTSLIASMAAEVCVGLTHSARGIDDDAVALLHRGMRAFDGAVAILQDSGHQAAWQEALARLASDAQAAPFLRGYAVRRLHDRDVMSADEAARLLSLALSPAVPPAESGAWIEGFLSDAAQLLLHDPALLDLIDGWLADLDETAFVNLLPALRRAVGGLDRMERRRLIEQIGHARTGGAAELLTVGDDRAEKAFARALPLLNLILGREPDERSDSR